MPKVAYVEKRFAKKTRAIIAQANKILEEYEAQGFTLTLRQLYYQFVARDLLKNTEKNYKNLGQVINDARLAGLVDWNHLEDRTRSLKGLPHWDDPSDVINSAAEGYHIDMWAAQKYRPEIWIEKDALVGVIEGVCRKWDVPYFSCRGYTSQSEMWVGAMRLNVWRKAKQQPVVFHFGDHDPSGLDMSRDIEDRLRLFMGDIRLERLALNMDQIEQYKPPPNPAKVTDSRFEKYQEEYGDESWELDALEPKVIAALIEGALKGLVEPKAWKKDQERFKTDQATLRRCVEKWDDVKDFLEDGQED